MIKKRSKIKSNTSSIYRNRGAGRLRRPATPIWVCEGWVWLYCWFYCWWFLNVILFVSLFLIPFVCVIQFLLIYLLLVFCNIQISLLPDIRPFKFTVIGGESTGRWLIPRNNYWVPVPPRSESKIRAQPMACQSCHQTFACIYIYTYIYIYVHLYTHIYIYI